MIRNHLKSCKTDEYRRNRYGESHNLFFYDWKKEYIYYVQKKEKGKL